VGNQAGVDVRGTLPFYFVLGWIHPQEESRGGAKERGTGRKSGNT